MGKSVSTSIYQTTSNATDQRMVVGDGAAGIHGDNNSVTIESVDAEIVNRAMDALLAADATAGQGYKALLATTTAQLEKVVTASNDVKGTLDQKTMLILAAIVAAVFIMPRMRAAGG